MLEAALAAASAEFARAWTDEIDAGCPTSAAQAEVEGLIDAAAADLVHDTVVSPHVDATQFTTYGPVAPTSYLGRTFTPICMKGTPYYFFAKRGTLNKLIISSSSTIRAAVPAGTA